MLHTLQADAVNDASVENYERVFVPVCHAAGVQKVRTGGDLERCRNERAGDAVDQNTIVAAAGLLQVLFPYCLLDAV